MHKKYSNAAGTTVYANYKYVWNENSQLASQNLDIPKSINFSDSYGHRTTISVGNYTTFIIYNELDEAVGFSIDNGTEIKLYYYMKDVTGQIDSVVDIETNTIIYSCTYDAWGSILDEYCTDALVAYGNPLRYKDYNYDIESGLYYLQSRYYDSYMGRFLNADEPTLTDSNTKNALSTNMYTYCENDSINKTDPTGKFVLLIILSIVLVKQNIKNTLSPYKKQITASNCSAYDCKNKGSVSINMENSAFARDIYDIYVFYKSKSLYSSLVFDVLAEFCEEKFKNKFGRNILFDNSGMSHEIEDHVLGYLYSIGYKVNGATLMKIYCVGSKSKLKEHCKSIDIREPDVYSVVQRTAFDYFHHVRKEYASTNKDPFYYSASKVKDLIPYKGWKTVKMK